MANAKFARPDFETKIITPMFRLSYPAVFEPKYNELAKREQYQITMLFDKKTAAADLKTMKDLMAKVAVWKFGPNPKGLLNPFKDGDTDTNKIGELRKEANPSIAGMIVLNSWSKNQPGLVNAKKEPIIDSDEIYGGCFCRAQLNAYAYETGGNRGVSFGLLHIQKVKDGDPFGNRTRPEDAFSSVESAGETEEVTTDSMFS